MVKITNKEAYEAAFADHLNHMSMEDAAKHHVGGIANYYMVGAIEARLLENLGLHDGSSLVDLGCGSGRLAGAINGKIDYLGTDVVEKLIAYCRKTYPGYRFEVAADFKIPAEDRTADFVVAFSLFTHLLHEESMLYMREAFRVLKPGGKLVLSFLEYLVPGHRKLFLQSVTNVNTDRPLIVFMDRRGLRFFGRECGFSKFTFHAGNERIVDFGPGIRLPDDTTIEGTRSFGQSVCVMLKA